MSAKIRFHVHGRIMPCSDAAYVLDGEDPLAALVEQVVNTIALDVLVSIGEVEMPLAMWQDPDHWEEDWRARAGDEDVLAYVAGLVESGREV
jgi:hypothetical protein